MMVNETRNRKQTALARLYALCRERGDMTFTNAEVKAVCAAAGFGNPFDATKIDRSGALPELLRKEDAFVVPAVMQRNWGEALPCSVITPAYPQGTGRLQGCCYGCAKGQ